VGGRGHSKAKKDEGGNDAGGGAAKRPALFHPVVQPCKALLPDGREDEATWA